MRPRGIERKPAMTDEKLILIVDDESFNRDIAARLVKKMGHKSVEFSSGQEILDDLDNYNPDLILLDIHMPAMNGLEVLKRLRRVSDKSELPILMITADSDPDAVVKAFELGANDYVTKPINSKTLRSRIGTHFQLSDASKQIKQFAEGAERLVAQCTIDLQRQNEELAREVKLRMAAEEVLLEQKLAAEKENKAKSEFFTVLTHELKTPLNIAIGFADLIANNEEKQIGLEQCREYGTYISTSANQLLNIVEDILTMSSYDIGKLELKESEVNIGSVIRAALGRTKPCPSEKNIDIAIDCPDEIALICDQKKIQRALVNILSNAVKFSPAETSCQVKAEILDNMEIRISVSDQGVGVSPHSIEQIMQPYQQNSAGLNRTHEGLGLGLPVARAILDLHGASMGIDSVPEKGTTVFVTFPPDRTLIQSLTSVQKIA